MEALERLDKRQAHAGLTEVRRQENHREEWRLGEAGRDILAEPTLLFSDAEKRDGPGAPARGR